MAVDLTQIEYTTRIPSLGEHVWFQRAGRNDWEAILQVIVARTNLTMEEACELTGDEIVTVVTKVTEAYTAGVTLQLLGRSLENPDA